MPETACHICRVPLDQPGVSWCSAMHGPWNREAGWLARVLAQTRAEVAAWSPGKRDEMQREARNVGRAR